MSYKDSLDRVRSQLTEEQASKVGADLKVIESEILERDEELTATRSEAKNRRLSLNEVKGKLADYEAEIEQLKQQTDKTELTDKITGLEETNKKLINSLRGHFQGQHESIATHEKYKDAAGWFDIGKKEDESFDYESLTDVQIEKNLDALNKLQQIKFFGEVKKGSADDGKGVVDDGSDDLVKRGKELDELRKQLGPNSSVYQAKLAEYMKIKREKGV